MHAREVVVHELRASTAAAWFSTFLEKALVRRVKRRMHIRIVQVLALDVGRRDAVRVRVAL